MTEEQLADKIELAIRNIPANNPGYISVRNTTLDDQLSRGLLRRVAEVAAAVAHGQDAATPSAK